MLDLLAISMTAGASSAPGARPSAGTGFEALLHGLLGGMPGAQPPGTAGPAAPALALARAALQAGDRLPKLDDALEGRASDLTLLAAAVSPLVVRPTSPEPAQPDLVLTAAAVPS
ncbi:MAG: hypothetical protein R3349_12845, partial [Geminicoccaceae bacterium]|nr:hypothetical protein [Geminicoccaceae bacterium]